MLSDLLRTDKTYATRENALKALEKKLANYPANVRFVIAVNEEGRFAPVVFGVELLPLAHQGITVVG